MPSIPFHKPSISKDEIEAIVESLESGWLTTGPKTKQFEKLFAEYVGANHAVAVNSCTAALHLALEAVGITEGDEVLTTPMTFAATAEVIRYFNARPVFVDINSRTMNLDVYRLRDVIEERKSKHGKLKAIIPVHYAGQPCQMDTILELAEEYDLKVIEDAAHSLPARFEDKNIGCIGDITCFSFYATKTITTGEGGMITTENDDYAERMRVMSLHGISKDAWKRYMAEGNWYYEIVAPGFKYNMTDMAASLGVVQLGKADYFQREREKIALKYSQAFSQLLQVTPPHVNANIQHSWHLYVIKLNLDTITIDRNQFIEELKSRGIGTSVHFIPLHIHPYYREKYNYQPEDFPVAYDCFQRIISLPIYPGMTDQDVERVIEAVIETSNKYKR